MEVLGLGPEGRTCSEFDCSTGRKNLACPCFDRANEMNEENSRSFPLRDLAVSIGSFRELKQPRRRPGGRRPEVG